MSSLFEGKLLSVLSDLFFYGFKGQSQQKIGFHVGFYTVKLVHCGGPLIMFKCVKIVVPKIFKNEFLTQPTV